MVLQGLPAETALLPWWVLYVVVLGSTWGVFRLSKRTGWAIPLGCLAFFPLLAIALLSLPDQLWLLILGLSVLPVFSALFGFARRGGTEAGDDGAGVQPRTFKQFSRQLMPWQPRADAVLRSKAMAARFAAGMPRDAQFVGRVRYARGIGDLAARPVDLFTGGGQLWVAPVKPDTPPVPIPARNVLRVDLWPETEGPPTLRVSWSPPAGELTAELVLEAMPNVPPEQIQPHLQALSAAIITAVAAEAHKAEQAEVASMAPMTFPPPPPAPGARHCSNCGETIPPGATACPRCAMPV
ncbi:MAG TPA: zinc ribbon domain-containing protein [Longimicrobium sp.]|nr:zinc ribbon domain-containing protein [Longimicrobium sp.]